MTDTTHFRAFVSYRRADSRAWVERILDVLRVELGSRVVFQDTSHMPLGEKWPNAVQDVIARCSLFIPVIGHDWLTATNSDGSFRLFDHDDPVCSEIAFALSQHIAIIPVLLDGAQIPSEHELPETIRDIRKYTFLHVRPDPDFQRDMERLILECRRQLAGDAKGSSLPIPPLPRDAQLPVRVLASAAFLFRGVFIQMAEGKTLKEIYQERGDYMLMCDRVVNVWSDYFGIPEEAEEPDDQGLTNA